MDMLTVDGWTVVEAKTYSAKLVRIVVSDGHGRRLSLLVPKAVTTAEALAPLVRARVEAAVPLPPEGPPGPAV